MMMCELVGSVKRGRDSDLESYATDLGLDEDFWAISSMLEEEPSAKRMCKESVVNDEVFFREVLDLCINESSDSSSSSAAVAEKPGLPIGYISPTFHVPPPAPFTQWKFEAKSSSGGTSGSGASTGAVGNNVKSFLIFEKYAAVDPNTQTIDASGIFGEACYNEWIQSRKSKLKNPYESYRRAIMSHLTGLDGRKPFSPQVEAAILRVVRRNEIWECFKDKLDHNNKPVQVGLYGFRGYGYWEMKQTAL